MLILWMAACSHPKTLQYDFGNSYNDVFATQSDLERLTVADQTYPLNGMEGLLIRYRAMEESTDKESGDSEISVKN